MNDLVYMKMTKRSATVCRWPRSLEKDMTNLFLKSKECIQT